MTVHEALSTLKVLGKRVDKEIENATFVKNNKASNAKIDGKTIEEYQNDIKAVYQSICDLIRRREAIRKAVTLSNATTKVTIGDTEMTVAEAIEYNKTGKVFKEELLEVISYQYRLVTQAVEKNNGDYLEGRADDYVQKMYGSKESGVSADVLADARKMFISNNTQVIIDPINCKKVIKDLSDEIDLFNSKVDSALSVSNAITTITVTY